MDLAAQRRRTISRCQRKMVSGLTSSRSLRRRSFGITASRVARSARSAQSSLGRRGCRRCSTASWWRRIKISAVFHVSSRRDSRSHVASRMIRRNKNRRHMIDDHHGPNAWRANLLVRAVDGILDTHRVVLLQRAAERSERDGGSSRCPRSRCRRSRRDPGTGHTRMPRQALKRFFIARTFALYIGKIRKSVRGGT